MGELHAADRGAFVNGGDDTTSWSELQKPDQASAGLQRTRAEVGSKPRPSDTRSNSSEVGHTP